MGGLRKHIPITFWTMTAGVVAIAGIPPLAGFFSKDEILGTLFDRAHGSTLHDAHWLGIPGGPLLMVVYGLALAAALMTAIYMTRLMIYTFHGPSRTGEAEQPFLKEAPWVMTGPLLVLGVLSAIGGFINVPSFFPIGSIPTERLTYWLAPVVGDAVLRTSGGTSLEPNPTTGVILGMIAAGTALVGILIAVLRLHPKMLKAADEPQPAEPAFERVLEHKYYVDELYDRVIVDPLVRLSRTVLWKGVDGMIDGTVNATAWAWRWVGRVGAKLQTGQVGTYAWVLIIGVLAVLGAFSLGLR